MNKVIINVPTGKIGIIEGEKNKKIEFVSIGDYGKENNIKADFLGLSKEINGVEHYSIDLTEKWVITVSTQYGCSMNCKFCDVPSVGKGINVTYNDLKNQLLTAIQLNPEVKSTKRLNIHYARMGEPTFNNDIIKFSKDILKVIRPYIGRSFVHPVISTMLPKNNKNLVKFLNDWTIDIKNDLFRGEAGLQFSINSTCDKQRGDMFSGNSLNLSEISEIGKNLIEPKGRKYTLNFALCDEYEVDAKKLASLFDKNKFIVKITPIHITSASKDNNIKTEGGYETYNSYKNVEKRLKEQGFDVIVFIPSKEEDESRITCGNAILSDFK